MKTILAFCIALLGFASVYSQNTQADTSSDKVFTFTIVQQKPFFQGDITKWLSDNIVYPKQAIDSSIQGTVYVGFVIEKDGSTSSFKLIKGVREDCDREAIRLVKESKWNPALMADKPVRCAFTVPIDFTQ